MARAIAALFGLLVLGVIAIETVQFVRQHVAPTLAPLLGILIGVAAAGALAYLVVRVFAAPTQRIAERARDELDYRYQRSRAASELRRRVAAIEEEQRVRALTASARVHENALRAVSDGKLQLELEDLRGRSERVVMRSQSTGIAHMLARYQAAFHDLEQARHMTPGEKARLLEEIRGMLALEGTSRRPRPDPEDEESGLDWSAQPPVVLEYRAPGGQAVPVTAHGFRLLLERGQLDQDDECRHMGSTEWTSVAEILGESSLR